jgi:hypothetical protein
MAEAARGVLARRWRSWLRAMHRDTGYLVVGLTVIYAVSGIAVNHIDDWNANYIAYEKTHPLPKPLAPHTAGVVRQTLDALGIDEQPRDIFDDGGREIEMQLSDRTLVVDRQRATVLERVRKPRPFVRLANWLHLNRGKRAWTYIADSYAVLLLLLAFSGMIMLPGKKGLRGRGAVLIALGSAVPVIYVVLSGGP